MSTLFQSVELAPRDPILGMTEQFNADTRPGKVNLAVGVYYDDNGKIPLLDAVRKAEIARAEAATARGYLPIEGIAGYNKAAGVKRDFSFVMAQRGMFSYSGLTAKQVDRLRDEHGIYAISTGRICVAALNSGNIDAVVKAIAEVMQES